MPRRLALVLAVAPAAAPAQGGAPPDAVVAPPPPAQLGFVGPYVGGSVGAGRLDADDVFEGASDALGDAFGARDAVAGIGEGPDAGFAYGAHAGFDVRRGRFVFGPELAVFGGGGEPQGIVAGTFPVVVAGGGPAELTTTLDFGARLVMRGGVVAGGTLLYGLAGLSYLSGDAPAAGAVEGLVVSVQEDDFDELGYAVGFGAERLVGPLVIGAQYTLHRVEEVGDLDAGLGHRVIELRASLRF